MSPLYCFVFEKKKNRYTVISLITIVWDSNTNLKRLHLHPSHQDIPAKVNAELLSISMLNTKYRGLLSRF